MTRIRIEKEIIQGKFLAILLHFMWSKGVFLEKSNKWNIFVNTEVEPDL